MLATLLIILVGKSLAAFGIVRAFGYSNATALTISASLAQIGEFSFILANLGVDLVLLPEQGRDLILAGAIISILLNPFLFSALDRLLHKRRRRRPRPPTPREAEMAPREPIRPTRLENHVVLVGHGRVGSVVSRVLGERERAALRHRGRRGRGRRIEKRGIAALAGNAADPEVIEAANLGARALPSRRHSRRLRGRPGGAAGPRHQSRSSHHCPRAFRGRNRAPQEARRQHVVMGEHEIAKSMLDTWRRGRRRHRRLREERCERLSDALALMPGVEPLYAGAMQCEDVSSTMSSQAEFLSRAGQAGGRAEPRPPRSFAISAPA